MTTDEAATENTRPDNAAPDSSEWTNVSYAVPVSR